MSVWWVAGKSVLNAPRHTKAMDLISHALSVVSGVDTSVVGASGAHAFWWRRTPKSGV